MINVNGERRRPLGEVLNFPVTVKGMTIPIDVVVTDATDYSAIVGNDWLAKVKANIDYETSSMLIHWEGKDVEVPIEYSEMPLERRRKREEEDRDEEEDDVSEEEENEEDETEEEEYEEEDLDEKILAAREFIRKKILSLQTKEFIWMSPSTSGRTSPGWTNNSERSHLSERLGYTIGKDLPPVVGVVNDYTRRAILVQDVMGKSPIL
ncbi:hypothetical protein RhiirA1_479763 [Rhizophagus irregularis]|uniref:Gag-pol fusion protein n=1 Tax=Rhizophagus irregularis TaxID=588596 RepID=A0A2N0QQ85_9GLOM|nr:hypothetical protein RhiirA1_479763 [Rhizophagus irregularis]